MEERNNRIEDIAQAYFKLDRLRNFQYQMIEAIYPPDSKPANLLIAPTGVGKSLCFTLPILLDAALGLQRIHLIIYPLRSLIRDQERRFQELGIETILLIGGQSQEYISSCRKKLRETANWQEGCARKALVLLATPEILLGSGIAMLRACIFPFHITIDEAHSFSSWGLSFRPSYRALVSELGKLKLCGISAYTATAPPDIQEDLRTSLFLPLLGKAPQIRELSANRPMLRYHLREAPLPLLAIAELLPLIAYPALIFCPTRAYTEECRDYIRLITGQSLPTWAYHAGLPAREKARIEAEFFLSESGVLCATSAYGMGVDKANIRSVVHLFPPKDIVDYMQESGRAGRDGQAADAYILIAPSQEPSYISRAACIRTSLLLSMHSPLPEKATNPCCDSCDPRLALPPSASLLLVERILKRYPYSLTRAELAHILEYARVPQGMKGLRRLLASHAAQTSHASYRAIVYCGLGSDYIDALIEQGIVNTSKPLIGEPRLALASAHEPFKKISEKMTCLLAKIYRYFIYEGAHAAGKKSLQENTQKP